MASGESLLQRTSSCGGGGGGGKVDLSTLRCDALAMPPADFAFFPIFYKDPNWY